MLSITIRRLSEDEISRVAEIDRTERVRVGYRVEDDRLIRVNVAWDSSPWRTEGEEHSIPQMLRGLEEILSHEGVMLGAFDDDRLVGIAAYRPDLTNSIGQLAFLHVSNGYRRQGIASCLYEQIEELARQSGAEQLYVSATPSESAGGSL
ncbi:GNAT family N-acetyltransferase [Candidatus Bipolaricaulota bacterium]